MFIYRSWGAVPALALMGCLSLIGGLCDGVLFSREPDYSFRHGWPIALALLLAGLITLAADRWRASKHYDDGHLFFLSPRVWAFMCLGGAPLYLLAHYT